MSGWQTEAKFFQVSIFFHESISWVGNQSMTYLNFGFMYMLQFFVLSLCKKTR